MRAQRVLIQGGRVEAAQHLLPLACRVRGTLKVRQRPVPGLDVQELAAHGTVCPTWQARPLRGVARRLKCQAALGVQKQAAHGTA